MHLIVTRRTLHHIGRLDAQAIAVQLPAWPAIGQPQHGGHDADILVLQSLGHRQLMN
jgi:hypothetical protein